MMFYLYVFKIEISGSSVDLVLHMKEKWINATTHLIEYSTSRFFLQFIIIYNDTKTKGKYYTNQVAWIENVSEWWEISRGTY